MKKCDCVHKRTGTEQTLDELDWERGIWGSAIRGDLEKVKRQIKNINLQDKYGYTALHYAARSNQHKIVEFLLSQYEIDPNLTTNGGASALHRAAIGVSKGTESLELLLASKIDKTLTDDEDQNFLHKLAKTNFKDFDKLLEFYSDLDKPDKFDKLPADYR